MTIRSDPATCDHETETPAKDPESGMTHQEGKPRNPRSAISNPRSGDSQSARAFLRCAEEECASTHSIDRRLYSCPLCGGLLDVAYDFDLPGGAGALKATFKERKLGDLPLDRSGVWRFRELLPFATDLSLVVTIAEGNTPIFESDSLAQYAGLDALRLKHQGMNPTGSFKDNGMTTGISRARMMGASAVACASTGNTSASMAAYAARAGLPAYVLIPADKVAHGKLAQALEHGATVLEVAGNFDDALGIIRELSEETGLYLLNSVNPFRLEGQKTIMIEMMEQLGWRSPDWVVLPGGNLGNASAFGKALYELASAGFIERLPRLAVVQAQGAAPFYKLVTSTDRSRLIPVTRPETLATAIRIGNPISWKKALRSLTWTDGVVEKATEQEIADAKAMIGRAGIGCEPASAAALAGLKRLVASNLIHRHETVVCVLTGHLLKDPDYTISYHHDSLALGEAEPEVAKIRGRFANHPIQVAADKEEIRRLLQV